MSRSCTVGSEFWNDPKIRGLDSGGKLVAIYCLTTELGHVSGLFYLPLQLVSYETGLSLQKVRNRIRELEKIDFIRFDPQREIAWILNYLRRQLPSDSIVVAANKQLQSLHNSPLVGEFVKYYAGYGIKLTPPIGTPPQKPEILSVSEEDTGIDLFDTVPEKKPKPVPVAQQARTFLVLWNRLPKPIPRARCLKGQRLRHFKARIAEKGWAENYPKALEKIPKIPGLMGKNSKGWRANVDWFLRVGKVEKILDGDYDQWGVENPMKADQKPSVAPWKQIFHD
jgi:hypothetical protein